MFGTDGIRGIVDQGYITEEFASRLGFCVSQSLLAGSGKVVVGFDTRESSPRLAEAFARSCSAGGASVVWLGVVPTPAVAYEVLAREASLGLVVTASHNPYQYNGFKFFGSNGTKIADADELVIERTVGQTASLDLIDSRWSLKESTTSPDHYLAFLMTIAEKIGSTELRAVVDCANGALSALANPIFQQLCSSTKFIGNKPNGRNINEDCGSTSMSLLQQEVRENKADFGIAFDGDADRLLLVGQEGQVVDGDQILYLLARYGLENGTINGGVVGTLMSNAGLEKSLDRIGIPFVRARVGDRFVLEELVQRDWNLGGEPSGHVIRRDLATTGDGLLTALGVIEVMSNTGSSLNELTAGLALYPQLLRNVKVDKSESVLQDGAVVNAIDEVETQLDNHGRVLVRASGTEPLIRIMVECEDQLTAEAMVENIEKAVTFAQS